MVIKKLVWSMRDGSLVNGGGPSRVGRARPSWQDFGTLRDCRYVLCRALNSNAHYSKYFGHLVRGEKTRFTLSFRCRFESVTLAAGLSVAPRIDTTTLVLFWSRQEVKSNGPVAHQTAPKYSKSFPTRPINEFRQPLVQSLKSHPTRARRPYVVIEEDVSDIDDIIDLGAPRLITNYNTQTNTFVPRRPRRHYVPNPRLYPGPQSSKKPKRVEGRPSGRSRRRKVLRQPLPNSRLYRPAPPRPLPPPPLQPRAGWGPPPPARILDTASRVALCLGEQRRVGRAPRHHSPIRAARLQSPTRVAGLHSPPSPPETPSPVVVQRVVHSPQNRRLVVTLPQAASGDSHQPVERYRPTSAHFKARDTPIVSGSSSPPAAACIHHRYNTTMDTASRHSASPEDRSEGNDTQSAPSEFLAEFLSAIMRRQYAEALKYCRLILQYEPQNATARGFYPLLRHKVQAHRKKEAAAEGSPSHAEGSSNTGSSRESDAVSPIRVELTPDPPASGHPTRHSSSEASAQAMDQEDSADSDADDVDEGSVGSVASQSSLELDSSDVMHSSPSVSLSRQTDSACWESTGSASRSDDADDNGNAPAPASTDNTASNIVHPGDLENDNASGEPVNVNKKSAESLRRLREQFACSIK